MPLPGQAGRQFCHSLTRLVTGHTPLLREGRHAPIYSLTWWPGPVSSPATSPCCYHLTEKTVTGIQAFLPELGRHRQTCRGRKEGLTGMQAPDPLSVSRGRQHLPVPRTDCLDTFVLLSYTFLPLSQASILHFLQWKTISLYCI